MRNLLVNMLKKKRKMAGSLQLNKEARLPPPFSHIELIIFWEIVLVIAIKMFHSESDLRSSEQALGHKVKFIRKEF